MTITTIQINSGEAGNVESKQKPVFSAKTLDPVGVSNTSSTLLMRQTSMDVQGHDELESRPHSIQASSLRATSSPNEDDINVHRRY